MSLTSRATTLAGCIISLAAVSTCANAGGITVYKGDNGEYIKIGGRIQLQYHYEDPDDGSSTDDLFFRRLRPYVEGSLHPDWLGKFQIDYGKADGDDEVAIKDAYFQYKGFENMKVTIGNANFPFSREFLTSSKYQQLVERTFVGDHNYGTPDRNLGIHLTGHTGNNLLSWGASATMAAVDPENKRLDFDTPVNRDDDFNEGWMFGGRIDYMPFGKIKLSQGDFGGEKGIAIGLAAFTWNNDNDNNTYKQGQSDADECLVDLAKCDVDSVTGYEADVAFRGGGFSVDAEYNLFDAELVENGITGGIYKNSDTDLKNWAIEGGYMVIPGKLEFVLGYQDQNADNYDEHWTRQSIGINYFIKKNDIKIQATWRRNDNKDGIDGNDENEGFIQTQFVF
jgi:hypothetical protein